MSNSPWPPSLKWPIAIWPLLLPASKSPLRELALFGGWQPSPSPPKAGTVRHPQPEVTKTSDHHNDISIMSTPEASDVWDGDSFCSHKCPFAGLSQWGNITPSNTCYSASFLQSCSALLLFCSSFSHLLHGRWESAPQTSPGRAKYVGAIGKTAPYGSCLISKQKLQFFENWWAPPV